MATDSQAMGLLIRMMPLMQREFSLRIEPAMFFDDSGYRDAIIDNAQQSAEPRLAGYAGQMRARLAELSAGRPARAVRSAKPAPAPAPAPPEPADAQRKYVGRLR